jgi:hypothetical protein
MAASILRARFALGLPARLVFLGDGRSLDVIDDHSMVAALDTLAMVDDDGDVSVADALRRFAGVGRSVIICSAVVDAALIEGALSFTTHGCDVVVVDTSSRTTGAAPVAPNRAVEILAAAEDPPTAWNRLMRERRAATSHSPPMARS